MPEHPSVVAQAELIIAQEDARIRLDFMNADLENQVREQQEKRKTQDPE